MKIVHFCLSCFYIDGFAYQENQLVAQHVKDGNEVTVIASTEIYNEARHLDYVAPSEYMGSDGAKVIRLPYRGFLPAIISRKLRAYSGVRKLLNEIRPDAILFHGACAWELLTVAKYAEDNPHVALFVDSHEDFNNSARTFLSKYILHLGFYRPILHRCLPYISEVLGVTVESVDFVRDFYGVPAAKVSLFPLAGHVVDDESYMSARGSIRNEEGVSGDDVVIVQSGKIGSSKRLPAALESFIAVPGAKLRFWIVGEIVDEVDRCEKLIRSDSRIKYLGWQTPDDLQRTLCAADVYLQPFGQTATTQMAICCRCAIVVQDLPSHRAIFCDNGFLLNQETSMVDAFSEIARSPSIVLEMKINSKKFGEDNLDYAKLAARIYQKRSTSEYVEG